jgi:preprotein translocase subunit SecG
MLLGILLTINVIVALALAGVVLLQRSEGGALGMGGGGGGMMTARGAGDLLTRTTWILGGVFFALSLTLTVLTARDAGGSSAVDRVDVGPIDPAALNQSRAPAPAAPTADAPLSAPTPQVNNPFLTGQQQAPAAAPLTAPAPAPQSAPANP